MIGLFLDMVNAQRYRSRMNRGDLEARLLFEKLSYEMLSSTFTRLRIRVLSSLG